MKITKLLIVLFLIGMEYSVAQISISNYNFTYNQNFNALAMTGTNIPWTDNTTVTGWYSSRTIYNTSDGSGSNLSGSVYSFGTTGQTDRALGSIPSSGTGTIYYGVRFVNNSGQTITSIPINYTGEQWRTASGQTQKIDFQYQIGNAGTISNITSGTWTDFDALDFIGPIATTPKSGLDGNLPANRVALASTLILIVNTGQEIWFRWMNSNFSGNDQGLSVDDFVFNAGGGSLPVELSSLSVSIKNGKVILNWRTETEVNNYGFEILRQAQDDIWNTLGFVQGYGNSNSPKNYSFIDENVIVGKYSYRLKEIDTDGNFEYSKLIEVDFGSINKFELSQNYPNPFNPITTIRFSLPESGNIKLTVFNIIGEQVAELVNGFKEAGIHTVNFDADNLNSGNYIYRIEATGFTQAKKMTLIK
jgi:hypothetical protein